MIIDSTICKKIVKMADTSTIKLEVSLTFDTHKYLSPFQIEIWNTNLESRTAVLLLLEFATGRKRNKGKKKKIPDKK